jgi:reductive dehalogenase
MGETNEAKQGISRRDFLKIGGLTGAVLQVVGFAGAGLASGQDIDSYTGYKNFEGVEQTFNRKAYEIDGLPYEKVGEVRRPGKITDLIFFRGGIFHQFVAGGWKMGDSLEVFPPPLAQFYAENPDALEGDWIRETEVLPNAFKDHQKYDDYFALADAYAIGWEDLFNFYPPEPTSPPEVSDYTLTRFGPTGSDERPLRETIPFKSPDHAAQLIKKIAHQYGATIVGITKLNPDFCYDSDIRGGEPGPFEIPAHWEYAIVFGVPHEWDQVLSNPAHGTSYDGYNRVRNVSGRLTAFIKSLGYPARSHHPPVHYDLVCPPIAVDAGLGETGRHGFTICPETGSNIRLAVVTTNIPMTVDKPIEFGVAEFCNDCKICAEQCPSGSISLADSPKGMEIRGYEHWFINTTTCYNFWLEAMGPLGCRLCLAVCPYSRKDNWVHQMAKVADINDPTGMVNDSLVWMQKSAFEAPDPQEYRRPPDGRFAGYRPAPEWLEIENWFAISPPNPQKGE